MVPNDCPRFCPGVFLLQAVAGWQENPPTDIAATPLTLTTRTAK